MTFEENVPDNPQVITIRGLENNARRFLIRNQNITRGVEKRLRRSPDLARQLDRIGGLQTALTEVQNLEEQRQAALNFTDYSNTLYLDQFFGGNPDSVPLAQTMAEDIGSTRRTAVAIAEELNDCCEEIKSLLRELLSLIPSSFAKQRFFISTKVRNFTNYLNVVLSNLVEDLHNYISNSEEHIKTSIHNECGDVKRAVKSNLEGTEERLKAFIAATIEALPAEISAIVEALLQTQISFILAAIGGLELTLDAVLVSVRTILNTVNSIKTEVENLPVNLLKKLEDFYKKHKDEFISEVAEETSLRIVGESYYKWNSTNSFYPTLVFKFKEVGVFQKARVTQLKVKLKYTSSELTDQILKELKSKLTKVQNLSYIHGSNRGNFVSQKKHFKTTIFGSDKTEIEKLLNSVLDVIEEPFIKDNLSITFGRKRDSITRRTEPLGNTKVFIQDYNESFKVQLYRVILLVNGLEKPLVFYKK